MERHFRIYDTKEEHGVTDRGGVLLWSLGCNSKSHVDSLDEVFFKEGEVAHAEHLAYIERGPCDGRCTFLHLKPGGFIHPTTKSPEATERANTS